MTPPAATRSRGTDPGRLLAFDALREVHTKDAYANLVLARLLRERHLDARDAAFATELFSGTCRMQGSYDVIIEAAAGRGLASLQPAVVDLLRLADIDGQPERPDLRGRSCTGLLGAFPDRDLGAEGLQAGGDPAADPGSSAGDDGDAPVQPDLARVDRHSRRTRRA